MSEGRESEKENRWTDGQAGRQRETQTDRWKPAERQSDKEIDTLWTSA